MHNFQMSGRIITDPESRDAGENHRVVSARVAVYGASNEKEDREGRTVTKDGVFTIEAWDKQGEFLEKIGKGGAVEASGTFINHAWTDQQSNSRRERVVFKADRVGYAPKGFASNDNNGGGAAQEAPQGEPVAAGQGRQGTDPYDI